MHAVEFHSVSKNFDGKTALDHLTFSIEEGSFTVVCGPPGAGKSVLLRTLVGLETLDSGLILLGGRDITAARPSERNIGYVPQSFALYPHLSVFNNIAYPLHLSGVPRAEVARKVEATAAMLSITHLLKKTPDQLSGGEKQRVAVARGLMRDARVFVLDDPLVGLDYKLRERLMDELKQLCEQLATTFLYATSDSLEALTLARNLVVLDAGRIIETAPAIDLYHEPQNVKALEIIGFPRANLVPADAGGCDVQLAGVPLALPEGASASSVILGVRPEHIVIDAPHGQPGRVTIVEHLGAEIVLYADVDGQVLTAAYPAAGRGTPMIDSIVTVAVQPEHVMAYERQTGRFLGRCTAKPEV